jgi:hypothetical protein
MDVRVKSFAKLAARLAGVAFGLALALFVFSSVAFGHGYDGRTGGRNHRYAHPVSYRHHSAPCRHVTTERYNNHWSDRDDHSGHSHGSTVLSYRGGDR